MSGRGSGQLRQRPGPPLHHPEPPVGNDLDGPLQRELLHGLPHGSRGDAEALAQQLQAQVQVGQRLAKAYFQGLEDVALGSGDGGERLDVRHGPIAAPAAV